MNTIEGGWEPLNLTRPPAPGYRWEMTLINGLDHVDGVIYAPVREEETAMS
ncbi:hypothetical protein [Agromyces humi]|uniref:hypothetical protein n=1 Tax=Agromyces humi TaxID=1766800 RepID=UPI00135C5D73|nr:hypothetical protein [Agromyces humi]